METMYVNSANKATANDLVARPRVAKAGWWQRFLHYAEAQQPNRFGWLAFSFFMQGCVLVPVTLLLVAMNGNPFILWIPCLAAFVFTEIVNLAAMPTKITIPVFWMGVSIDLLVIAGIFLFY